MSIVVGREGRVERRYAEVAVDKEAVSGNCRRREGGSQVCPPRPNKKCNKNRPRIGREYPLNLSISLSGGKETNEDSLSSGERSGRSPSPNRRGAPHPPPLRARMGINGVRGGGFNPGAENAGVWSEGTLGVERGSGLQTTPSRSAGGRYDALWKHVLDPETARKSPRKVPRPREGDRPVGAAAARLGGPAESGCLRVQA